MLGHRHGASPGMQIPGPDSFIGLEFRQVEEKVGLDHWFWYEQLFSQITACIDRNRNLFCFIKIVSLDGVFLDDFGVTGVLEAKTGR